MAEVCANSEDTDQMSHSAVSDLGMHYLPNTLLWVSQLQWDNDQGSSVWSLSALFVLRAALFVIKVSTVIIQHLVIRAAMFVIRIITLCDQHCLWSGKQIVISTVYYQGSTINDQESTVCDQGSTVDN